MQLPRPLRRAKHATEHPLIITLQQSALKVTVSDDLHIAEFGL